MRGVGMFAGDSEPTALARGSAGTGGTRLDARNAAGNWGRRLLGCEVARCRPIRLPTGVLSATGLVGVGPDSWREENGVVAALSSAFADALECIRLR